MILQLILFLALLHSLPTTPPEPPEALRQAVGAYWQALEKRDKAAAMQFVYPEDLNNFLNRQDAVLRNSHIVRAELVTDDSAKVVVSFERSVLQTYLRTEVTEAWVKTDQGWKIRVEKPMAVRDRIQRAIEKAHPPSIPESLEVLPKRLLFYGIAPQQQVGLRIQNGLKTPAEVVDLEYDKSMIALVKSVKDIPPRRTGTIFFRYAGPQLDEENVDGKIVVKIRQDDEIRSFEVPVVYNYMNALEEWFKRQQQAHPPSPER